MKGAGALLLAVVFIVHCSLSVAIPISGEQSVGKDTGADDHKSDQSRVKKVGGIKIPIESASKEVEEIKKPIEPALKEVEEIKPFEPVARRFFPAAELRHWQKFMSRRRPLFIRNIESRSSIDQLPSNGQKSTHIDLDIIDDNVDRALDKAAQILNRMKNTIKSNDGFFFLKELSQPAVNQNYAPQSPHQHVKGFLPLVNKMEETVQKLADVSVEHKEGILSPQYSSQLKHEDERRSMPKLLKRVKAMEDTVHFLTWIVLIFVFILLFVCVVGFVWISCGLVSSMIGLKKPEGVKLAKGPKLPTLPRAFIRPSLPTTFRI